MNKKPLSVYLAGPMTGIKDYNAPAFNAAAAHLRSYGYEVFNPVENDLANGFDPMGLEGHEAEVNGFNLRKTMKENLSWICDAADGIALLDAWQSSPGTKTEKALGDQLGLTVMHYTRFNTTQEAAPSTKS